MLWSLWNLDFWLGWRKCYRQYGGEHTDRNCPRDGVGLANGKWNIRSGEPYWGNSKLRCHRSLQRWEYGARECYLWQRRIRHPPGRLDRKSTRLNSSHLVISYAVFCLKKKN